MIRRPWLVAAAFALSALLLGGALAWMTRLTLELERSEVAALERAVYEENVRIALWRMDASLAALIARENARPGGSFVEAAAGRPGAESAAGAVGDAPGGGPREEPAGGPGEERLVRARFAVGADGELRSEPRLPPPAWVASLEIPPSLPGAEETVLIAAGPTAEPTSVPEPVPVEVAEAPSQRPAGGIPQRETPGMAERLQEGPVVQAERLRDASPEVRADRVGPGSDERGRQSAYTQEQLNRVGFEQRQQLGVQSNFFIPPPSEPATPASAEAGEPAAAGDEGGVAAPGKSSGAAEAEEPSGPVTPAPSQAAGGFVLVGPRIEEPTGAGEIEESTTTPDPGQAATHGAATAASMPDTTPPAGATGTEEPSPGSAIAATEPGSTAPVGVTGGEEPTAPGPDGPAEVQVPAGPGAGEPTDPAGGEEPAVPDVEAPTAPVTPSPPTDPRSAAPAAASTAAPRATGAPIPRASPPRARPGTEAVVVESAFMPRWLGDDLVLLRRVRRGPTGLLQGVWLDWGAVQDWLLGQTRDLLPAGELQPGEGRPDPGRSLALLPARLAPGPMPAVVKPDWTPVRLTLAAAWGAVLLAVLGVGGLLVGTVRLSQRRADFASAVTHELRTPLTTFRLYSEMLRDGMVADEDRSSYLETLSAEAGRLEHLVTNVLAFSRLEQGKARSEGLGALPLGELLGPIVPRLRERADRGGLGLEAGPGEAALERVPVRADPAGVEQILANLVDNACKYAAGSQPPVLHLEVEERGPEVVITLRDHGPGVGPQERRRLFRPFHKSARHAAETAPGVGLGLALSRRLARGMGGSLRLARSSEGAAFELALRRGSAQR